MTRRVAPVNVGEAAKLAPTRERWHDGDMARRKKTPEISKIARVTTVAYARKQRPGTGGTDEPASDGAVEGEAGAGAGPGLEGKFDVTDRSQPLSVLEVEKMAAAEKPAKPAAEKPARPAAEKATTTAAKPARPAAEEPARSSEKAAATAEKPPTAEKPATEQPAPAVPVAVPVRAEMETASMPVVSPVGAPPEMPPQGASSPAATRADAVEDPPNMPGPKEIPDGAPGDPAAAPGSAPPGDSRSMRRRDARTYEFALIYRRDTFLITRFGVVGTRGQWRVVEYPTSASASHAYAKECSRFVSDGFSDYRE